MPSHLVGHLGRQPRPRVEHGQHHAEDLELRVQHSAHQIERLLELPEAFERIVLALDRNEHRLGGGQRVHRQQPERRRAVDQQVIPVVGRRFEAGSQARFPGDLIHELHLGAREIDGCRHHRQVLNSRVHNRRADRSAVTQALVDRGRKRGLVHTEAACGIPLGVHIHQEHAPAEGREARAQVDGRRRLPHPAFLIDYCDREAHAAHTSLSCYILRSAPVCVKDETA